MKRGSRRPSRLKLPTGPVLSLEQIPIQRDPGRGGRTNLRIPDPNAPGELRLGWTQSLELDLETVKQDLSASSMELTKNCLWAQEVVEVPAEGLCPWWSFHLSVNIQHCITGPKEERRCLDVFHRFFQELAEPSP